MLEILGLFLQAAAGHILYLALHLESGSFPRPLSQAKEKAAFAALRTGGADAARARDLLIRHNLRLVAHVAKKYYTATFDPLRTSKFSSYASRCIENELRMELRRTRREGTQISLQEPLEGSEGQLTLADTLPDPTVMEDRCENRADAVHLRKLVEKLPPRERELLTMRYGLQGQKPCTQQEVAQRLGISRSYVSRIEKRALEVLSQQWSR